MANIGLKNIFEILFFTLSSVDIGFLDWKLWQRTYTTQNVFSTTRRIKLVEKIEFAVVAFDLKYETFIVYVASLTGFANVYSFCRCQISGFIIEKAFTKVFAKYGNFANLFSLDMASKLFKYTEINNYAIKLVDN